MLQDLFLLDMPVLEKIVRTVLVYALLLVLLRVAGKRELTQLNPFDFVVLLMLSNTVQNAIIGDDNTFLGGTIGAVTLIGVNQLLVRFLYKHKHAEQTLEGDDTLLIENGTVNETELRRQLITHHQLRVALRQQGFDSAEEVERGDIDATGSFIFQRHKPTDDEKRQQELIERLDALTSELAALRSQLGSKPAQ